MDLFYFSGGEDPWQRTKVDHWLLFASNWSKDDENDKLNYLESFLSSQKWLVGSGLTIADICIFAILLKETDLESYNKYPSVSKWCKQVTSVNAIKDTCTNLLKLKLPANWMANAHRGPGNKPKGNQSNAAQKKDAKKESGTFEQLPGAEMGKVCNVSITLERLFIVCSVMLILCFRRLSYDSHLKLVAICTLAMQKQLS